MSKETFTIKIENNEWNEALDKSFDKAIKKVKIDGFRPGKAPKDVYLKKFGPESLYMEAVDMVLPGAYSRIIKENNLNPMAQPSVDIKSIDATGVAFEFKVVVKPEVKLGKYKGLKVKKDTVTVTKEEIDHEIEHICSHYSELLIKEDQASLGDTAVIDFEGFKDGQSFEGGKGENHPLELGSNTFIPGFEEQVVGMKKGDTKDIKVTFPADYHSEDLKGQEVTFKVTVNEVKTKVVPEINEDFFKDLNLEGVNSEQALRDYVETNLKARKEADNENIFIDELLKAAASNIKVEIDDEIVNEEIDRMMGQFEEQLKMQGIGLDMYYQITKSDENALRTQMTPEAKNRVTYRLMLEAIANNEGIEITDSEASNEAASLASKYQVSEDEFLKTFGGLDMVKYDMLMRRTLELLKDNN